MKRMKEVREIEDKGRENINIKLQDIIRIYLKI
jgi:hypothetical protein